MAENSETEITNPHILMFGTASLHRTSRCSVSELEGRHRPARFRKRCCCAPTRWF